MWTLIWEWVLKWNVTGECDERQVARDCLWDSTEGWLANADFFLIFGGDFLLFFLGYLTFFRIKNVMRLRQELVCEILPKADLLMLVSPWNFWLSSWFFGFPPDFLDFLCSSWLAAAASCPAWHGRPAYFLDNYPKSRPTNILFFLAQNSQQSEKFAAYYD